MLFHRDDFSLTNLCGWEGQLEKDGNLERVACHLIWRARVPRILARSYLVMYLEVFLGRSVGCLSSFSSPSAPAKASGSSSLAFSGSSSAPSCKKSGRIVN